MNLPLEQTLDSKAITETVLAFAGSSYEICGMLQQLNHRSRAYIVGQNGLKGKLSNDPIPPEYFRNLSKWAKDVIRGLAKDRANGLMHHGTIEYSEIVRSWRGKYIGELDS